MSVYNHGIMLLFYMRDEYDSNSYLSFGLYILKSVSFWYINSPIRGVILRAHVGII